MTDSTSMLEEFRAAVAEDLRSLALLHTTELTSEAVVTLRDVEFPGNLGFVLSSPTGREAVHALAVTVRNLPRNPEQNQLDHMAADFAAIYLTNDLGASPCESVWLNDEHIICQEPMFQVRDYYIRHGLAARDWRRMPDDHLVPELEFIAHLIEKGAQDEAACFLDEHLLRWLNQFAERLATRNILFYSQLAFFTWAYCEELRELLSQLLNSPRPSKEEIEARLLPPKSPSPQEFPLQYLPGAAPTW